MSPGATDAAPNPGHPGGRLVLVRHGQSTFNAQNRFTGWLDPELTALGVYEAQSVARRLRDADLPVDAAFSSAFQRTIRSLRMILDELGSRVEPCAAAELNERDYGDLTSLDKAEAEAKFGAAQVRSWRRSYATPPPGGESLRDTLARVAPFYLREILPVILTGATVLVVAHGNTLRALVGALEGLNPAEIEHLEIATGEVLVFDVAADARLTRSHVLHARFQEETAMAKEGDREWMLEALEEQERVEHGLSEKPTEAKKVDEKPPEPTGG